MKNTEKIPQRIFYVWGYGEKKSQIANICIENWRMMLPDFDIIEVNEKTPEWFDFDYEYNNNLWFKTVYDLKMWAYVSDYIRCKVLYDYGGIYFDTDVTVYKDFSSLLNHKMFIGNCLNNIPEMATFGAQKEHPILLEMINFYKNDIWNSQDFIITKILTKILKNKFNIEPSLLENVKDNLIAIYLPEYFNPFHFDQDFNHSCITHNTYSVHWMGASWHSKKNLFFLSNKHRIPLKTLLKQVKFIEDHDKNANQRINILQQEA
ncbi:TPA: glycosyltransferase [Candidatus Gastranaerophilales bacterium HUM_19]|nr:MAG TPA: glycosyltransferase [Candidatus Gastranaerophilales bacterium HUM_19]DAB26375.1 MAG TPA: glycosyltransferase [Candidatus Gastranaerophilales bacterium HUM_23]